MTPEQQKAIALANARKRKAEAMGGAQAAPPMSTRATEQFPAQEGLGNMSVPVPYPQRAGDLQGVRDYLSQSQAEDDARAAEREALRKRAAEAGRAETLRGLQSTSPMAMGLGGPSAALAGQSASDQVYGESGVMSPEAAIEVRGFNSALMGLPGLLNESARERIGQAGQDQPGAALLGDITGYLVPGEAAWQAGKGLTNAFARPIVSRVMPQGGSAAARGTRLAGRYGTQAGAWAGQNAAYQATVGESVRAAEEGRAPTLADAAGGAVTGATDWLNLAGPAALMGLNRAAQWVRTGGVSATPDDVARSVAASGQSTQDARLQATSVLDMDLAGSGLRPQAIDRVVRELQSGGLTREDVAGLFEAVNQRLSSLPEGQSGRLTVGQAMIEALERDFPQAAENILGTLRERRISARKGDRSAGIAGQVSRELRNTQGDFLGQSVNRNLGDQGLINIDDQVRGAKRAIGQEYERVLAAADPNRPEARGIALIVQNDPSASGVLLRRAQNAGFESVEAYVAAQPDAAGHWLRSALAQAARGSAGREKLQLETTVRQLDELLETNAGYKQAREAYGTEMGVDDATDFGQNFVAAARNEYSLDLLMRQLKGMSEREKEVALASVRNNLNSYMRGGPEEASARISSLTSTGVLDALERLGPQGKALADDLRFIRREQRFLGSFDPEANSRTAINAQAIAGAQARGNSPLANAAQAVGQPGSMTQDVVISTVAGTPLPIMTAKRGLGGIIQNAFGPRIRTLEDQTRFYMSRPGNVPSPPESPDFTPGFARQQTVPSQNAFTRSQGLPQLQNDAVSSGLYGGVGAFSGNFVDYNQDGVTDQQDMLIGAGVGAVGGAGTSRLGSKVSLPKGKGSRWDAEDVVSFADRVIADTKPKPITRAATEADFDEAMDEAMDLLRRFQTSKGKRMELDDVVSPRTAAPDDKPILMAEEMAAQILRGKGIDPDAYLVPQQAQRATNAETAALRSAFRAARGSAVETEAYKAKRPVSDFVGPPERPANRAEYEDAYREARKKLARRRGRGVASREDVETLAQDLLYAQGLDGSSFRVAGTDAGENVIPLRPGNSSDPKQFGIGNAFAQSVLGGAGGSAYGSQNDINGDGVIDEQDVFLGSAAGTVGVPVAMGVAGRVGNAFAPGARSMGAGGGRKPPPDSPEAITEAVRGISRSVPPTPPGGPVIPPRGNMRGVLQAPERIPPASPMADQVPPPLPPRPVSNRVPTSNMPNATEIGLAAGTGAAIGGAFLMEKANDPATFGLASFDELPPDHPLRDPNYRRMALMAQMQPQQSQNAFASVMK